MLLAVLTCKNYNFQGHSPLILKFCKVLTTVKWLLQVSSRYMRCGMRRPLLRNRSVFSHYAFFCCRPSYRCALDTDVGFLFLVEGFPFSSCRAGSSFLCMFSPLFSAVYVVVMSLLVLVRFLLLCGFTP